MRVDTPPQLLAADAVDAVHRRVVAAHGDSGWFRDVVWRYVSACDHRSPVEPLLAAGLAGAVATGADVTFQPQRPFPQLGYVADFAVAGPHVLAPRFDGQLVVEVDGDVWHAGRGAADQRRSDRIEAAGWWVVRLKASSLLTVLYQGEPHHRLDRDDPDGDRPAAYPDLLTYTWQTLRLPRRAALADDTPVVVDADRHHVPGQPSALAG